jgi:hypothetical protein
MATAALLEHTESQRQRPREPELVSHLSEQ